MCLEIWLNWRFGWVMLDGTFSWVRDLAELDVWSSFTFGWFGDFVWLGWGINLARLGWDGNLVVLEICLVGDLAGLDSW